MGCLLHIATEWVTEASVCPRVFEISRNKCIQTIASRPPTCRNYQRTTVEARLTMLRLTIFLTRNHIASVLTHKLNAPAMCLITGKHSPAYWHSTCLKCCSSCYDEATTMKYQIYDRTGGDIAADNQLFSTSIPLAVIKSLFLFSFMIGRSSKFC